MFRHEADLPGLTPEQAATAPTVSAIEMARISGVGRERLRTWERRHGFPVPLRLPNSQRRYLAADVRRVVAISRAIESGVPVGAAIHAELSEPSPEAAPDQAPSMESALELCATPVLALAGPSPLRVVWGNRPTIAAPDAPVVGSQLLDEIPHFGAQAAAQLQELMVDEEHGSVIVEHRCWTSAFPVERRSLAWRLPPEAAEEPTVVLMQLPADAASPAPETIADRTGAWTTALSRARSPLEHERGIASVQRALGALLRHTGGLDGFLSTYQRPRLRAATSVAGSMPARAFLVDQDDELAHALDAGEVRWLSARAARALGTPARSSTLVVPLMGGGDRVGAAFLVYPTEIELAPLVRESLQGFGMLLALTLQREHLAAAAAPQRIAA